MEVRNGSASSDPEDMSCRDGRRIFHINVDLNVEKVRHCRA
jgi:hypothetical protein